MDRATTRHARVAPQAADLDTLTRIFIDAFPVLTADDQQLAITLYRGLGHGRPVPPERLAQTLGRSVGDLHRVLSAWPGIFYDENDDVIGFWGLAVREKSHRLEWDGYTAYAWCAWDTLFLPELLDATVSVTSQCAQTREAVRLIVSPERIESVEPASAVVSFLEPHEHELRENVTTSFCHFVHFFHDRAAGARWTATHPGTFLLSLEEAYTVGRRVNSARYHNILRNPRGST